MPDLDSSPKRKRIRFSTEIMFILSVIFCAALSLIYLSRHYDIRSLQQIEAEQRERIEGLERENRMLKENLEMLSTPEGIERLARERLGLVKPEEVVVYTIDDKNEPINASDAVVITTPSAAVSDSNSQPQN